MLNNCETGLVEWIKLPRSSNHTHDEIAVGMARESIPSGSLPFSWFFRITVSSWDAMTEPSSQIPQNYLSENIHIRVSKDKALVNLA